MKLLSLCLLFSFILLSSPQNLWAAANDGLSGIWQQDTEQSDDLIELLAEKMNKGLLLVHRHNKRRQRPVRKALRKLFKKRTNPQYEKIVDLTKLPPEERKAKVEALAAGFTWLVAQAGIGAQMIEVSENGQEISMGSLEGGRFDYTFDGLKRPLIPSGNKKVLAKAHINRGRKKIEFFFPKLHIKATLFINQSGALVQELRMRGKGRRAKPTNAKFVYHLKQAK